MNVAKLSDHFVGWRDALLTRVLGSGECVTVTDQAPPHDGIPDTIAAELKQSLNHLKAEAISDDGTHVNYAVLRDSAGYALYRRDFLPLLNAFDPASLATRADKSAFWVNLYNALVIDAVIAFGVKDSVTEGRLGLLTFFRRAACAVGRECVSCDDIEHGILRANKGSLFFPGPHFASDDPRAAWVVVPLDPRIHFALNCASRSCPPVGVYDAAHIDQQLDLAARSFVDQSAVLDSKHDAISLSSIFKWYARDFGGRAGVIDFLISHLPDDERRAWLSEHKGKAKLSYQPYDWRLNI
jgi:hypothetical protein